MSNKESCGKIETSQRRSTTSSPNSDEDEKAEHPRECTGSVCSVRPLPSGGTPGKSDDRDILCCNTKRRQSLKRSSVDIDIPRKRLKISSSPQGPDRIQEAPHSNRMISQSPSADGTKTDRIHCTDFRDTKSKNVRGNPDRSNPKIAREVRPKSAGQAGEKSWHAVAAEREKVRKRKRKRNGKFKDSSGKCEQFPFSQDSHSNKIMKETLESRRKISFKIPVRSCVLQKRVEENVFSLDSEKSETKEEKDFLDCSRVSLGYIGRKPEHLFSDSTYKQTVEWEGTFRHEPQQRDDSSSGGSVSESFEAVCPSASSGSVEDTDQEMQIVEELHAARVGHMIDLPVAPPAGELMSMDIDLVEDDPRSAAANTASDRKLLIVVDTNILMNHLKFVRILSTTEIPDFDSLILIIPWVVVQELDRMKEGKLLKHAQYKAVPAVHFIHDSLRRKDRKLWGQSLQLACQRLYGLRDENNDDRVLKCCLQYQELFPCSLVILCTDDRNLRNKGLISGVKSLSKEELSAELLSLSQNAEVCHQLRVAKQQGTTAEATMLEKTSEKEPAASGLSILLESIVCDLEKSLGAALSSILETEMKIAFGNLWMEILYVKPPWTLIHLLRCFKKHWLAVFGLIMEKNLLLTIESIYENLCKANNSMDFTTVRFLLQDSKSLLQAFSARSDYDGVLPQAFAQVSKLLQTLAEVKTKVKPGSSESTGNGKQEAACLMKSHHQESTVCSGSHVPQPNRHQEIWSVLENVWLSICQNSTDVFQRLGTNSALSTSTIASLEEAFLYLQKLMAAVKDILEGIQRILAPDSNYQDVETLFNFLIKYEVNKNVRFTVEELQDCLSQTEYRAKLAIGCRQLLEMAHTMQQCSASVYMEARHRGRCEGLQAQP